MIKILKGKSFKLHDSGLWVAQDGEVYVPTKCRKYPNGHFTFGSDCNGYLRVMYKRKSYYVHILVADCWIPNPDPENLKTVDHISQTKTDNRVSNLRWASRKLQQQNRDFSKFKNNARSKPVYQYTLDGQLVKAWESTAECGRNGFTQSIVAACCRGVYGKLGNVYKGFIWSYEPL